MSATQIQPSYSGIVLTSRDALLLFTAAITGRIPMITRRPHDKERAYSIASGNVFIYCEHGSSIKRWTDGVTWSPSRIMGNFLIYRELNKGFPPGEKKRAAKKKRSDDDEGGYDATDDDLPVLNISKDQERSLIGSLIDSYDFKKEGLVKKTISVKVNDQVYHLVSYYTLRDAISGELQQPSHQSPYAQMQLIEELITGQNFRVAVDPNGTDLSNTNTSTNSASPPSSPGLQPSYRDPEYGHPQHSYAGSYTPSSGYSGREYSTGGQLQYEISGTRGSYHHFMTSSNSGRTADDLQLREVPRSYSGDFPQYSRSYSTDSILNPNLGGNGGAGMSQGRSGSASFASGTHFGTTDPSSYASGPLPMPTVRYMEHPLSLSVAEKSSGLNAYPPATRPHQSDNADDPQRPGVSCFPDESFSAWST